VSNSNNDQSPGVKLGFIFGFIFAVALSQLPFSDMKKAQDAVNECQLHLSRDQYCKIVAVPENNTANAAVSSNRP